MSPRHARALGVRAQGGAADETATNLSPLHGSMPATLTVRDQDGVRVTEVDCAHHTTTIGYANGAGLQMTDTLAAQMAISEHLSEAGCDCAVDLAGRYGVDELRSVIRNELTAQSRRLRRQAERAARKGGRR